METKNEVRMSIYHERPYLPIKTKRQQGHGSDCLQPSAFGNRTCRALGEEPMTSWARFLPLVMGLLMASVSQAEVMKVLVAKEIDDDHIIIVTEKGDQLLLEKWSLKFSPLLFEGKIFLADVSSMWVKMYIEGKGEIKWSIEKHLGTVDLEKPSKGKRAPPAGYAGVGSGHWIQSKSGGGKMIVLEDGSLWEVSPIDIIHSAIWLAVSNIVVVEDSGPYPYKLINTDDGETVNAKYLGRK